jgi:hypothetical protein
MMRQLTALFSGLALCLLPVAASADDAVSESVITAKFPDRSISALATHLAQHDAFKRAIVLMPGHPGIMKIQSPESFGM